MKKFINIILLGIFLIGCGRQITKTIDGTVLSKDKATIVIYPNLYGRKYSSGFPDALPVMMDIILLGHVSSNYPLKVVVSPGTHTFYVDFKAPFTI